MPSQALEILVHSPGTGASSIRLTSLYMNSRAAFFRSLEFNGLQARGGQQLYDAAVLQDYLPGDELSSVVHFVVVLLSLGFGLLATPLFTLRFGVLSRVYDNSKAFAGHQASQPSSVVTQQSPA